MHLEIWQKIFLDIAFGICYNVLSRNEVRGKLGMQNGAKGGPVKNGFSRGDVVQFYSDNGGWRTGVYRHTVERGKKFGKLVIEITVPAYERKIFVGADRVKPLPQKGVTA